MTAASTAAGAPPLPFAPASTATATATSIASTVRHLPALDALRGVAILAVVCHHMYIHAFPPGWWLDAGGFASSLGSFVTNGWFGVNLFFVLSGFVLYWPMTSGPCPFENGADIIAFYKRRALRLLPLFYFSSVALASLSGNVNLHDIVPLLTLTFNFQRDTYFPAANFVLWSLGVEIWFSVVFPFIVIAVRRAGWTTTACAAFAVALGLRLVGVLTPQWAFNDFLHPIKDSFLGRIDDLVVGMLIASIFASGFRFRRPSIPIVLGFLLCLAAMLCSDGIVLHRLSPLFGMLPYSMFQGAAALVILGMLSGYRFRFYPLELLGLMCYSIYVWHAVVMMKVSPPFGHTVANTLKYVLFLGALSWLSYRYIEFGHVRDTVRLLPQRLRREAR